MQHNFEMVSFEKLTKIIQSDLIMLLSQNKGLNQFAKYRSKFEGWLKVELVKILNENRLEAIPEKDRIDITIKEEWAIELKTVNTNYRYLNVENKTRPITKNISSILKDIEKLKYNKFKNKAIIFITFPVEHSFPYWKMHLKKIEKELNEIKFKQFFFENEIPGVLYIGLL